MSKTHFNWLIASQQWNQAPPLKKGATHAVKDYDPAVVAEWVKSGAAAYADVPGKNQPIEEAK